jgi:nitronate monooxygenase
MREETAWPLAANLRTPVCDLLGCTWPIVLAGMGGVARSELVAAVTRAGGFGFLGMVREPVALIRSEVEAVRAQTDLPFGVNLIPAATPAALLEAQVATCIEHRVPVVALFWSLMPGLVERLRAARIVVVCQVGSLEEALAARAAGADALIVQGVEAGGHVRGRESLMTLLPRIAGAIDRLPLLAAGGIVDGQDVATVMALGAQGAVCGTAFAATQESFAHDFHKQKLVEGRTSQTRLTDAFHVNWPREAHVRVLSNSVTRGERGDPDAPTRQVIGDEDGRPIYLFSTDSPLRSMTGDFEAMALYAGNGVDRIHRIVPAAGRLREIVTQAASLVASGAKETTPQATVSSAPCHLHELEPQHRGYWTRGACVDALNTLLEAERAGARVAMLTAAQLPAGPKRRLVLDIQRDEARWCSVLTRALRALDAEPSRATGTFLGKAMGIEDIAERLTFLNRGQGWVVRKLQELLPQIANDALHADLQAMLDSHVRNIERVDAEAS